MGGDRPKNRCFSIIVWLVVIGMVSSVLLWPARAALAADYEDEPKEEPIPATGLVIDDAEDLQLIVGDERMLAVTVEPEGATCPELEWTSSNEDVATVDEDGLLKAVGEGSAQITVTGGGLSDTCEVRVLPEPAYVLQLKQHALTLAQHDTIKLALVDEHKHTGADIEWTSSDPDVATVDASGNVTARGLGEATILVSDGVTLDACDVRVVPHEIRSGFYTVDRPAGLLKGVRLNTTVEGLKNELDNDADLIEVYRDGEPVESGRVGTGMTVKLVVNGNVNDELILQVAGDVDGDGVTSIYDYTMARLYLLGHDVGGINPELFDISADGRVSITDYTVMRLGIMGLNPEDNLFGLPDAKPVLTTKVDGCAATLSWKAVTGASGYELQRASSSSGPYDTVRTVGAGTLKVTDATLTMDSSYYYRLQAYRMVGDVRVDTQFSESKKVSTPAYTVYYQGDSKWKFSSSVAKRACVVAAFAITVNNMGIPCTPPDIYKSNGNQTPIKYDKLKKNFGVKPVNALSSSSKYLSKFDGTYTYVKSPSSNFEAAVKEALARNPEGVILYFKKGSSAHAIVACKLSSGKIYYSDPGRNRTTLQDFANTWCKVGHNMSYKHLAYMIALDKV